LERGSCELIRTGTVDGGTTPRAAYMQGIGVVQPFSYRAEVRRFYLTPMHR
jgi:hypothetical protein